MSEKSTEPGRAGLLVAPDRPVSFTYEEKTIPALAGQTIAAALYRSGVRTFSRSPRHLRPRGLLCLSGDCSNCLMQVDGRANVRTCVEPVQDGSVVLPQFSEATLNVAVKRIFGSDDRVRPGGLAAKQPAKSGWFGKLFDRSSRKTMSGERADSDFDLRLPDFEVENLHAQACVIGGGPAGLAAALAAAKAGVSVLLLDRQPRLGGHLLYDGEDLGRADALIEELRRQPSVRILCDTTVFSICAGNEVAALHRNRFLKIRTAQIVLSTGARELPFVFQGNDLPGVLLGRGVQRLARLYGLRAGHCAVVLTNHDDGLRVAKELYQMGMRIAAVVDTRPAHGAVGGTKRFPVHASSFITEARGSTELTGITLAQRSPSGMISEKSYKDIDCDVICMSSRLTPANELLLQSGLPLRPQGAGWIPRDKSGLGIAGGAAGTFGLDAQLLEGRLRGGEAASALGYPVAGLHDDLEAWLSLPQLANTSFENILPSTDTSARKRYVCLCEDVVESDLEPAEHENGESPEFTISHTHATLGWCHGKLCQPAFAYLCGARSASMAGEAPVCSQPASPVELGVLAAGRHLPVRRSPLHYRHNAAGASWREIGSWTWPWHYGDPAAEALAARTAVGLCDFSHQGKFELVGAGSAELLERVFLDSITHLASGSVCHALMTNEEGSLFADAWVARLAPDRFYLTTRPEQADSVYAWLERWRARWSMSVVILDKTALLASIVLVGPRARSILSLASSLDVSAAAFPNRVVREGIVAGHTCRILRTGASGAIDFELHCPAAYADNLWETLNTIGSATGLRLIGTAAMRSLLLEKGQVAVGHDTGARTSPFEAGFAARVHFDKPDFIGRDALRRLEGYEFPVRLTGFTVDGNVPPEEGSPVVHHGAPVGRVCSACFSPTLDRCIGLAWVPPGLVAEGTPWTIRSGGNDLRAIATKSTFHDPSGELLLG